MLTIKVNVDPLVKFSDRLQHVKPQLPAKLAAMVQEIGPEATSHMKRVLPAQTGLKFGTINRALKGRPQGLRYEIKSKGGNIRLKFFSPRETRRGVSAAPWNKRQIFPGTFTHGGFWPNRAKTPIAGGNVFRRTGSAKYPIESARSGLFIANEMITGNSAVVFYGTVNARLGPATEKLLASALSG